jgi:hypothetical protein
MLDIGTIFLGAYLASYAVAVVMPTWRWLLALTIVAGVMTYAGWLRDWIALLLPNANEGPGGGLGSALALGSSHLLRWGSSTAYCHPDRLTHASPAQCHGRD